VADAPLPELVEDFLSFSPDYSEKRFNETGWTLQGECTVVSCPNTLCTGRSLWIWRKPYESGERTYSYWGIVCSKCKRLTGQDPFENQDKKSLRGWSQKNPVDEVEIPSDPEHRPTTRTPLSSAIDDNFINTDLLNVLTTLSNKRLDWALDPSFKLHPTWEQSAWELVKERFPQALPWLTPQASLNRIANDGESIHWVDFLFHSPWRETSHVIEIDGNHKKQLLIDEVRDAMLTDANSRVWRFDGPTSVDPHGDLAQLWEKLTQQNPSILTSNKAGAPLDLDSPDCWPERWSRKNWDTSYTTTGGRFREEDPLHGLTEIAFARCHALSSHVFIASTPKTQNVPSNDVTYWATVCQKILQRGSRPIISGRAADFLTNQQDEAASSETKRKISILGPAALHRFGLALTLAAQKGHLPQGQPWNIKLDDPLGIVEKSAGAVIDILRAVDDVWSTKVVPDQITVGKTTWKKSERYETSAETPLSEVNLTITLDPFTPPHAALPSATLPSVIIRSAYLPIWPDWLPSESEERREISPSLALHTALRLLLEDLFGHEDFREGQLGAILRALGGKDTAVMLPTGAGKSLIFQMAGLLRPGITLAIDPLISLINDQDRGLRQQGINRTCALTGPSLKGPAGKTLLEGVSKGNFHFVFLTPERLQIQSFRDSLVSFSSKKLVNLAVVDEAHCVSEWGHDFRTSYLQMTRNLKNLCCGLDAKPPPIIALTATASPAVRRNMFRELLLDESDPDALQTPSDHRRPNLHYSIELGTPGNRHSRLSSAIWDGFATYFDEPPETFTKSKWAATNSGIVFVPHVNGKFGTVKICEHLKNYTATHNFESDIRHYSGKQPSSWTPPPSWDDYRTETAQAFILNECSILVATKAFGMGIDKPNIRFTVHYGMPQSIESFAQESGRAGRDRNPSQCYLLATFPPSQDISELLDATISPDERQEAFNERQALQPRPSSDLDHQLFFHYGSFPGHFVESSATEVLFGEIWEESNGLPGTELEIPKSLGQFSSERREKALYRLSLLGIVYDYTIRHGPNGRFEIELDDFDNQSIDEALIKFEHEIDPGRGDTLKDSLENAPASLKERCIHHIKVLVDIIYRTIEPARIRALDEMYRLATSDLEPENIAARMSSYLGDGLLASSLESTITGLETQVRGDDFLTVLRTLPLVHEQEREGATARQLEQTPNHPLALIAAALTQIWADPEKADSERFKTSIKLAFSNIHEYVTDEDEAVEIFLWILDQVRNPNRTHAAAWEVCLWDEWPVKCSEEIMDAESTVLATPNQHSPKVVEAVLNRRILRWAQEIDKNLDTDEENT
jgi:ATP-dependent DNA helicase RecQ